MDSFIELYKKTKNLHHAYFFVGNPEEIHTELIVFLTDTLLFSTQGNPDYWSKEFETFSISDGRELARMQENKAFGGEKSKKIFVIRAHTITEEAQNALLKVFEEPTPDTHFFIISPQDNLLPTLLSRVERIHIITRGALVGEKNKEVGHYLDMDIGERMELVKEITDGISDEEKTKQDAIELLNTIEKELYTGSLLRNATALTVCEHARQSLYDRGAPVKMILEHVMLSI